MTAAARAKIETVMMLRMAKLSVIARPVVARPLIAAISPRHGEKGANAGRSAAGFARQRSMKG
jgi:hypothetical protein